MSVSFEDPDRTKDVERNWRNFLVVCFKGDRAVAILLKFSFSPSCQWLPRPVLSVAAALQLRLANEYHGARLSLLGGSSSRGSSPTTCEEIHRRPLKAA